MKARNAHSRLRINVGLLLLMLYIIAYAALLYSSVALYALRHQNLMLETNGRIYADFVDILLVIDRIWSLVIPIACVLSMRYLCGEGEAPVVWKRFWKITFLTLSVVAFWCSLSGIIILLSHLSIPVPR